jgi:hypothetical protein
MPMFCISVEGSQWTGGLSWAFGQRSSGQDPPSRHGSAELRVVTSAGSCRQSAAPACLRCRKPEEVKGRGRPEPLHEEARQERPGRRRDEPNEKAEFVATVNFRKSDTVAADRLSWRRVSG